MAASEPRTTAAKAPDLETPSVTGGEPNRGRNRRIRHSSCYSNLDTSGTGSGRGPK
jgi:hypothetical protein